MSAVALLLMCMGGGTAVKTENETYSESSSGSYGHGRGKYDDTVRGTTSKKLTQEYTDQVDVEIYGDFGRIRLPQVLLPVVYGGKDGWFKLRGLKVTEKTIEASAGVNFMNRPKVHIDRVSGSISVTGEGGNFAGKCQRVDAGMKPKF